MKKSSAAEAAIIDVLRTFKAAVRYWPTELAASYANEANNLVIDYECGHEIDWALALDTIVYFHTEMGEWIGSH